MNMKRIILITVIVIACGTSPDVTTSCNQIAGYYTGPLKMGFVEGLSSLNISNNCNFTYTQELKGYDISTQTGIILMDKNSLKYEWADKSDFTVSHDGNKVTISGYNWSAQLEKK